MKIVTGYTGMPHITSNDDQARNQAMFGHGNYILNVGNKLNAILTNATTVTLEDGDGMIQGVHFRIEPGMTEAVSISPGTTGYNRTDLICARYTKEVGTGIEDVSLVVIEGTPSESTAEDPIYVEGDILAGDTLAEFPLWRVTIEGLTPSISREIEPMEHGIEVIDSLFNTVDDMEIIDLGSYSGSSDNHTSHLTQLNPGLYIIYMLGTLKAAGAYTYNSILKNGNTTVLSARGYLYGADASIYVDMCRSAPLLLTTSTTLDCEMSAGGDNRTWNVSWKALRIK